MIKNTRTPNSKGSVGKETANPKSISLILIARGVRKVMSKMILSSETKYKISIRSITGNNAPQ